MPVWRFALLGVAIVLLGVVVVSPALARDWRVALLIGHGAYQHAPRLSNPVNDAEALGATLRSWLRGDSGASPAPQLIETPRKRTVSVGGVWHDDG